MGLEYTLVNHQNKTCFELGKGAWYALCDKKRRGDFCLLYQDETYDTIVNEIWDYNIAQAGSPEAAASWRANAKELAKNIFAFVNNVDPSEIELCHDSDDSLIELRQKGFRWTGSRYYEESLDDLNSHLKI